MYYLFLSVFGFCVSVVYTSFLWSVMLDFLQVSMAVSITHDRIVGRVQLDQVIAKSFAVPLIRK